jgi:hypothetical protein
MSRFGFHIGGTSSSFSSAMAHAKRKSKAPITLPPLLIAPRIDAANPAPTRKVKKNGKPKKAATKEPRRKAR